MYTNEKEIVGRDVSPSNRIVWVPAEGYLPMKQIKEGNRLGGAIALFIGFVWVSFFINKMMEALERTILPPELLMIILVTLPGFFVLLYGISQYIYYEETAIDHDSISWKRRGLSGSREWLEPISNYRGVLKQHSYWTRDDTTRHGSRMIYSIRLIHDDPAKEIVLYEATSGMLMPPPDWVAKWKQYAGLLRLPVVEKTESGLSSSDVSDLEAPLIDKIRDGKLKIPAIDPLGVKLGLMAMLTRDDGAWVINLYPVWNAWKSIAGVIVIIIALLIAYSLGLIDPRLFRYFLWLIPVCLLAIGMSIRKHIVCPEQLALDKTSIYYRFWNKQKGWITDQMPLHSICNISVKSNPGHFRTAGDVVIEGKNMCIRFGWWLPGKTKLRIETLLISLIASDVIGS